jgi:phospholipase/carboxylesterase
MRSVTRRHFLALAAISGGAAIVQRARGGDSRLRARPKSPTAVLTPGEHALGLGGARDGLLRIPAKYRPGEPAPLAVLLHGAGGGARRVVSLLGIAESFGVIVLAPESRDGTWDAIRGAYGPDVDFVNRALEHTFERWAIEPRRLAIGGFSDGATYALSLGLDNGDLFTHVLAFSPGFVASRQPVGRPRIFVSHGRQDEILPVTSTSRRLVPALEDAGYHVNYREFDGPHTVPPAIAQDAFVWFTR